MGRYRLDPEWCEKADVFLEDAARHLSEGHYWLVCFEAHQAAEIYLKSLILSLTSSFPYTHDLSELLEILARIGISTDESLMAVADLLTPHYTLSRYPGRRAIRYNRERANRCLESSRKIVEWVKRLEDP
ncbi:MAG: HEPN domain-containing protein [Desulfurococcales archaeon]|nr:HEPN domain-containing protein [Desulfurococcales archaeon]